MGSLAFISQMTTALAWPMVVVVLLILLRPYLGGLTERLESLRLPGGAEAKFKEELAKAQVDANALQERITNVQMYDAAPYFDEVQDRSDDFKELSRNFPEVTIHYSFQEVERVLDEIAPKLGLPQNRPITVMGVLQKRKLIDGSMRDLYDRLSNLRYIAGHRANITLTQDDALEYLDLTRAAIFQLRQIKNNL
jgi:hypothetical protein